MDQLFMIEVLVDKIIFNNLPVPQKKQIVVQATCGSICNLEIRTDVMGAIELHERAAKRKDVDVECGRSLVFIINPQNLKKALSTYPLKISVATKLETVPIGTTNIPWNNDYIEMIDATTEAFGYVSPVYTRGFYSLTKDDNTEVATIEVFVRLTNLGKSIATQIQIVDGKTPEGNRTKQFLFKSMDNATTFQCQKFGMFGSDTDVAPIAPIYGAVNRGGINVMPASGEFKHSPNEKGKSTETILGREDTRNYSMQSMTASVFDVSELNNRFDIQSMFSDLSAVSTNPSVGAIRAKRIENLFLDFRDLWDNFSTVSVFDKEPPRLPSEEGDTVLDDEGDLKHDQHPKKVAKTVDELDYKCLTVKEIEERLCKHPDCPAAKLFKNYGIGPLAKVNGLGGMYNPIEAPITYGLSHLNGKIDGYGPLGTYSRPKRPEEHFIPKSEISNMSTTASLDPNSPPSSGEPMRLRGGGPVMLSDTGIPDPKHACQDLMDDFNKLLKSYKDALGPCGQATCPFNYNVTAEACRRVCAGMEMTNDPVSFPSNEGNLINPTEMFADTAEPMNIEEIAGCGVTSCPYKRDIITPADKDHKKLQSKAGCGSPTCPYVRDKLGLPEETDISASHPCAGKQCPFSVPDALPPIHWDCPDPLPIGDCKNPDCPLIKKDQILDKYFPKFDSPCHAPSCPYATVPCTFPGCPFANPEPCPPTCPYTEPPPTELECTPSVCPFAPKPPEECDNADCPYKKFKEQQNALQAKNNKPGICPYSKTQEDDNALCALGTGASDETIDKLECVKSCDNQNKSGDGCNKDSCMEKSCPLHGGDKICDKKGHKKRKSAESNESSVVREASSEKHVKKSKSSEEHVKNDKKKRKKRKHKKKKRCYVYDEGTYYPGLKIGHRECIIPNFMVPPDMGWLWNIHTQCLNLRPRRGWKPGAIGRTIAARIDEHRKKFGLRPISTPGDPMDRRRKRHGHGYADGGFDSSDTTIPPRPTLQVKKKDGVVYVTMNPLKDPKTIEDNENPYMDCSPMQFKITPNKPMQDNNVRMCYCGEDGEEQLYSASSSELDIEFTPPAGIIRPERMRRKKNVCHTDTQYNVDDLPKPDPPEKGKAKGKGKGKGAGGKKGKKKK